MVLQVYGISIQGKVRKNNEDSILIGDCIFTDAEHSEKIAEEQTAVFAVADGMGGHKAGEVASKITLERLREFVNQLSHGKETIELKDLMGKWAHGVFTELWNMGKTDETIRGMGSTLSGILYYNLKFFWFNAGDSRTYIYRKGALTQLSTDHSESARYKDSLLPSNFINNCIGGSKPPFIDMEEVEVKQGDVLLICSDGLTDMLPDALIAQYLKNPDCHILVKQANDNGGKDNTSVVLIEVKA